MKKAIKKHANELEKSRKLRDANKKMRIPKAPEKFSFQARMFFALLCKLLLSDFILGVLNWCAQDL